LARNIPIGRLEKLFRNPIESFGRIKLKKVGAITFPKGMFSFLYRNTVEAVENI
jgi:hypothetical protein